MENTNIETESSSLLSLYKNGDYQSYAEGLLEQKNSFAPDVFHYNLGTAYSKMGQLAIGRFHLEKAKKYGPLDSRISKNLDYVKGKLAISDIDDTNSFFEKSIDYVVGFDLNTFVFISLLIFLPMVLMWKSVFEKSLKALFLSLLISLLPLGAHFYFKDYAHAIVLEESSMREGPNEAFDEMGIIQSGTKVIIGKSDTGWLLIKYPSFLSGWVKADNLGVY